MEEYKVVPISKKIEVDDYHSYLEERFIVIDDVGIIIDDAQGYGYKSANAAHKAMWYKFKGGKKKIEEEKKELRKFEKNNKEFMKAFDDFLFLEVGVTKEELKEDFEKLEKQFNLKVPKSILKYFI
jgi:hypothetical protein